MEKERPIGVFDSGVGGLSVVRELFRQLPEERIVYFADTLHVPYGAKSKNELILFADQISKFLIDRGVKIIVVACNTSSSVSLEYLMHKYSIPFVGVIEPGVSAALQVTRKKKIGIIATQATIKSDAHRRSLLAKFPDMEVFVQACPKLVPLVEQGITQGREVERAIVEYLTPLKSAGIDTLILGCTHYPFLIDRIKAFLGKEVQIVDPASETIEKTKIILQGQQGPGSFGVAQQQYFVSGDPETFRTVASKFLEDTLPKVKKIRLK